MTLAILGGEPAFTEPLHVGRPNLGDRWAYQQRLDDIWQRRWLSNNGRYVQEFEEQVAALCGRRYCVAVANGTLALEIMVRVTEFPGNIVVPAWTFIATAHACELAGRTPRFVDVERATHNIDAKAVSKVLCYRDGGILAAHLWGHPCNVIPLDALRWRELVFLLFDAAHAFGCTHEGKPLPSYGDAAALSFHATKIVNSGEGGAIVTDDPMIEQRARQMRNFGYDWGNVVGLGTNAKMSELHAALGLTNLKRLPDFIAHNEAVYQTYGLYLGEQAGLPGIRLLPHHQGSNHHYVVLEIDAPCPLTRDELLMVLQWENVLARRYFWPGCHRVEPYRSRPYDPLPTTERLAETVLVLPTGMAVRRGEAAKVGELIQEAVEKATMVRNKLKSHSLRP